MERGTAPAPSNCAPKGVRNTRRPHMDAADETPRDCALSTTLQIRPNDFDRSFAVRYSAIADLVQDMR